MPFIVSASMFSLTVKSVVSMRPEKNVFGINAKSVVAVMTTLKIAGPNPIFQLKNRPMSLHSLSARISSEPKRTISLATDWTCPSPAFIRTAYFGVSFNSVDR
jgi:hypothetical protein